MNARLFCKTGELAGSQFIVGREAGIGKSTNNQVVLAPTIISGNHAKIYFDENENCYVLEDLKSRNGTRLDGMRVTGREKLGHLHVITFADAYDFIFQVTGDQASFVESRPAAAATPPQVAQPSSGTMVDSDLPMMAPPLQAGGRISATMADTDMPSMPSSLTPGGEMKGPRTMLEQDMPSVPPSLQPGGPLKGPRTMMESDMPSVPPSLQPGTPMNQPKTRMDSDLPVVPGGLAPEKSGPRTVLDKDVPSVPRLSPQTAPPPPPAEPSRQAIPDTISVAQARNLFVLRLEKLQKDFTLKEGENIIGRNKTCDIFIDHSTVSRKHAVLRLKAGQVTVQDLGSSNHTFVDAEQISSEKPVTAYSKIKFGSVEARLIIQQYFDSK